jgi:hypothetical protein
MLHGTNHDFQVESRYSEKFDRPMESWNCIGVHQQRRRVSLTLQDLASLQPISPKVDQVFVGRHADHTCVLGQTRGRLEGSVVRSQEPTRSIGRRWFPERAACKAARPMSRHDLYGIPLPESVEERIRETQALVLAAAVSSSLASGYRRPHTSVPDHDIFNFRLGDGF